MLYGPGLRDARITGNDARSDDDSERTEIYRDLDSCGNA
jgi:hypothetical protein